MFLIYIFIYFFHTFFLYPYISNWYEISKLPFNDLVQTESSEEVGVFVCDTLSYYHFICVVMRRYTGSFWPKQSTTSIKGTILTVIKHSGRTTPPSHLYCNVLFLLLLYIYIFFYLFLFFIYTSTLNSAHPPSLKQHHQSSLRPLWEHRKSLVCLLLSLSFCSLFWEEMRGSRNDRRAWFGSLFLCVCVRVCVLIEKTGFDMTTPHKDPWHTLTFNTHWLLSHTDPYHTESLIKQRPLLLPVRRHYLRS